MARRKIDFSGCINFSYCKEQVIDMLLEKIALLKSISKKDLILLIRRECSRQTVDTAAFTKSEYAEERKDAETETEK